MIVCFMEFKDDSFEKIISINELIMLFNWFERRLLYQKVYCSNVYLGLDIDIKKMFYMGKNFFR